MQRRKDRWKPLDMLEFAVNVRDFDARTQDRGKNNGDQSNSNVGPGEGRQRGTGSPGADNRIYIFRRSPVGLRILHLIMVKLVTRGETANHGLFLECAVEETTWPSYAGILLELRGQRRELRRVVELPHLVNP